MATYSRETLKQLKMAYDKARVEGQEQFVFNGEVLVTDYAKYMIEHLENLFNDHKHDAGTQGQGNTAG